MKIIVNEKMIMVNSAEVRVDLRRLARQFNIRIIDDSQGYFINDKVNMYNSSGNLLIEGEIEYVSVNKRNEFVYAGRNNAKYIENGYIEKTVQFSEGLPLQTILEDIAGQFGLKIKGKAQMSKESSNTIFMGDAIIDVFTNMAQLSGQFLSSDAKGNIIIEDKPEEGDGIFICGKTINNREYVHDTTNEYDKYIVVAQSNYINNQDQVVDIKSEYGAGKFVKVIRTKDYLTEEDCQIIAKREYYKDRRNSVEYVVEVESEYSVEVNHIYQIKDNSIGLNKMMKVKSYSYVYGDRNHLRIVFENELVG